MDDIVFSDLPEFEIELEGPFAEDWADWLKEFLASNKFNVRLIFTPIDEDE
jgi:hypothetical protein